MTWCQPRRWRRAAAATVESRTSATREARRRLVRCPVIWGWASVVVVPHREHKKRRRCHTSVVGRPPKGRSRTRTFLVWCTVRVLNPHAPQRTHPAMTAMATTRASGRSSTTSSTRVARRWRRIVITSVTATGLPS